MLTSSFFYNTLNPLFIRQACSEISISATSNAERGAANIFTKHPERARHVRSLSVVVSQVTAYDSVEGKLEGVMQLFNEVDALDISCLYFPSEALTAQYFGYTHEHHSIVT